jgi:hypothetical protein
MPKRKITNKAQFQNILMAAANFTTVSFRHLKIREG